MTVEINCPLITKTVFEFVLPPNQKKHCSSLFIEGGGTRKGFLNYASEGQLRKLVWAL